MKPASLSIDELTMAGIRRSLFVLVGVLVGTVVLPEGLSAQTLHGEVAPLDEDVGTLLEEMDELAREGLQTSRRAEKAESIEVLKQRVDEVFETFWGRSSGLIGGRDGAAHVYGWKTRWQVSWEDFGPNYAQRYTDEPPEVTDVRELGILGRGRRARLLLQQVVEDSTLSGARRDRARGMIVSLNNVIGWMKMDTGMSKGERQPRVDLTREWDSRSEFWLSNADTGWLHLAASQAFNVLKTDYGGDLEVARDHVRAMTELIEKYRSGVDANGDGRVAPVKMEGGLRTVLQLAKEGGYLTS